MTRILPVLLLSVLAMSAVGCAEAETASGRHGLRLRDKDTDGTGSETATAGTSAQAVMVSGTTNPDATKVEISTMDANGKTTPVGTADVKDGKVDMPLPADGSPTGIFIVKVMGIGDALLGSATINGIPAFIKGFTVDVTADTLTSYKTEVLKTMAEGGTPGVQNYLNVLDTFVNAELAGVITVDGAITNDVVTLVGATAESVVAGERAIEDALQKAGIPVDFSALEAAQLTGLSKFKGVVMTASGDRISGAKNLIASIEASLANGAKPLDQAIFNAVVNGGAAFSGKMKEKAPEKGFAATKSAFSVESALSTEKVTGAFGGTSLSDKIAQATAAFNDAVGNAGNTGDLEAAKTAFTNAILGQGQAPNVFAAFAPWIQQVTDAMKQLNLPMLLDALTNLDSAKIDLPAAIKNALGGNTDAATNALRLVQKQVAQ